MSRCSWICKQYSLSLSPPLSTHAVQLWEQKLIESRVFRPQDFPITAARDYAGGAGFFYPGAPAMRPVYGQSVATMPLAQPFPPMPSYQMVAFVIVDEHSLVLGILSSRKTCHAASDCAAWRDPSKHHHPR